MADPRGRGFKRGTGKWHRPRRCFDWQMSHPATYGWQFVALDREGLGLYRQGDHLLVNLGYGDWAVVRAADGVGDKYAGWHVADITADVFGERHLTAPPENTLAQYCGVA